MTNTQMSARVGLFFLLGVALIWITLTALGDGSFGRKEGYELVTRFSNLKELKVGDEVKMAGVRIGSVTATRLAGRQAEAVLLINPDVQVSRDSTALIAMAGLLGSNYLALDLGTEEAGFLEPGDVIPSKDTPDLNEVVAQMGEIGRKVDDALGQFADAIGGGNGAGILEKVDQLLGENGDRIGEITQNLQAITAKINEGEGTLGRMVNDPAAYDRLVTAIEEIRGAATEAKTFISSTQSLVDQVKSGQGALGALLYDEASGENIKLVAQNLRELSEKLNSGSGTLGKLINDESLFLDAQATLRKVDRAVDGFADQGPITAVGAAANALF